MRIVILSDTHLFHRRIKVPDGDVLIHAGDLCLGGELSELERGVEWLTSLPHKHKIFVAGNHDRCLEFERAKAEPLLDGLIYLLDSSVEIENLKFWGSPWQPKFGIGWAFNKHRAALRDTWEAIPDDTDVLITHGPPFGILDRVNEHEVVGCEFLRAKALKVKPKLHVFGHIHESYGAIDFQTTRFINASICDDRYSPTNLAVVVEL